MSAQAVPSTLEATPTDLFLRRAYEEEGPEAALLLLNKHLEIREASGAGRIDCVLSNEQASPEEFVESMLQGLRDVPVDDHINIIPFDFEYW